MAKLDRYFQLMINEGSSDLHLLVGAHPKLRVHEELVPIPDEDMLSQESLLVLMYEILTPAQKGKFLQSHVLDFAYGMEGVARFRCNYLVQRMGLGAIFRIIPEKIKT